MNWRQWIGRVSVVSALLGSVVLGSVYLTQATVTTTAPRNDYVGNGAVATYGYTFRIFASSDLRVTKRDTAGVETPLVLTTDYTVTGVNKAAGGTITLVAGNLPSGYALTIRFDRTPQQGTDLRNQGAFFAETHETKFDELTRYVQSLRDVVTRSMHIAETEVGTSAATTIPVASLRAGKFLSFDGSGNALMAAGTSANLGPVSGFINTLLDDVDAATARATLGVAAVSTADNDFRVTGSADPSKKIALEVDGLTTATTRTRYQVDEDSVEGVSWEFKNLTMTATVSANALTVSLKTKGGTDATATNPIFFKFRNATVGTGDYASIALTSSLSLVASSGSTLGTVSGVAHRLYVGICNDAGTLRLFVYNPLTSTFSLVGIQDNQVYTSIAEGGAGAADSAQILYSGTAFSGKAIRLLGYIESTQATAGTWATTPSKIQLMAPGVKRTGDIIQTRYSATGAVATGTTVFPFDDTIPQITEGDEYMTLAITPTSTINLLNIETVAELAQSGGGTVICSALFQDATANALVARYVSAEGVAAISPHGAYMRHVMQAGTVSSTTFRVRAGSTTGTVTFNGAGGTRRLGGVMNSYMNIMEIFAYSRPSNDEPASVFG